MRKVVIVLVLVLAVFQAHAEEPSFESFQLFAGCVPLDVVYLIETDQLPVREEAIRAAVESRLRSARLFRDVSIDATVPGLTLAVEVVSGSLPSAFAVRLQFSKPLYDAITSQMFSVGTWEQGTLGITSRAETVVADIRSVMDLFIADYLRVNDDSCRSSD